MSKKLTTDEFISKAKIIHGDKYDYSKVTYNGNKINITLICLEHGEFNQIPSVHLSGGGCKKCSQKKEKGVIVVTKNEFINKAKKVHGDKYNYSLVNYINNKTKINIICPIHGIFEQAPSNHLTKSGCHKCSRNLVAKKLTMTTEEFILRANNMHGNKYDYSLSSYKGSHAKIKIICPEHGEFQQKANDHMCGYGCYKCNESKGEREIRNYLKNNNIIFTEQKKFSNCKNIKLLPFDFYLPEYNICIEFNGRQHYEPLDYFGGNKRFIEQQKRDKIKMEYCLNNNIPLIVIKHNENINSILKLNF
jgi:hypothetical protein